MVKVLFSDDRIARKESQGGGAEPAIWLKVKDDQPECKSQTNLN